MVDTLFATIRTLADRGITVLLVEQNLVEALQTSSSGCVLEQGLITRRGPASELLEDEAVKAAYLGI